MVDDSVKIDIPGITKGMISAAGENMQSKFSRASPPDYSKRGPTALLFDGQTNSRF
jgi:hypothetical protein